MIWILTASLISAAAIFKAVADTVAHHFDTSIFKKKRQRFWNPAVSSTEAVKIFSYKVDAWHLSNSAMIVCMIGAAVLHQGKLAWYFELVIGGVLWNLVFNLFYDKVLR